MELQETIFLRQAGQGVRPGDPPRRPQHQVLASSITQRPRGLQAQAQDRAGEPVQADDGGGQAIAQRVEGLHLQVFDHLALTRQAPPQVPLFTAQRIGSTIAGQPLDAMHQAGMTAAGAATEGHRHASPVQGIEQVAARLNRPAALTDCQFRHRSFPRPRSNDCVHHAWPDKEPGRPAAGPHPDHRRLATGSFPRTGSDRAPPNPAVVPA